MAEIMLEAAANSTSMHYGVGHMCRKHNKLFTLEHIETCDEMSGYSNVRRYANRLRSQHILDWEPEERHAAILGFALLSVQMKSLEASSQATLIQTQHVSDYVKTGRKRGRPILKQKAAETSHKID